MNRLVKTLVATAAALTLSLGGAVAETYPSRNITLDRTLRGWRAERRHCSASCAVDVEHAQTTSYC